MRIAQHLGQAKGFRGDAMNDPLPRRIRRIFQSLIEASGWRALKFISSLGARSHDEVQVPSSEAVALVIPPIPYQSDHIPPIIFQTWKSRSEIPDNYRYWRQTFSKFNPEAIMVLWDDNDNRSFVSRSFPWFLSTYDGFPKEIFRADAIRYFFLFTFGGLYADMDGECLASLNLEERTDAVLLGQMGRDLRFEHAVPNAFMASQPGQAFWLLVIQRMVETAASHGLPGQQAAAGPEEITGPVLLKRSFDEYKSLDQEALLRRISPIMGKLDDSQRQSVKFGRITLLSRNTWYPLDWTNLLHKELRNYLNRERRILSTNEARCIFPEAELVTYWSHSW